MHFIFSVFIYLMFTNFCFSSSLLSHKATYNLTLERKNMNSLLEGGVGKSTFLFQKTCSGWSLKENFMITYNLANKKSAKSFSVFKTFEDFKSKRFSFDHYDKSELSGEINYSGFVKKKDKNLSGKLIDKNIKNISYDGSILLPTEHLIKLINFAKEEKKFFNSDVFFGSNKNNLIKRVTAFIGRKKLSSEKSKYKFLKKNVWPINLAFYNFKQKKAIPETEISLEIDEEGVVHFYNVDYGDYIMIGKLDKIEVLEKKDC